jgi:peptidoglycan hydrolase-like protein with peptidoglycan-binding domain
MKRFLVTMTATALLVLPLMAAGQPTPIPPEAARQTPLTQRGEQDISQPSRTQESPLEPRAPRRERSTATVLMRAQEELRKLGYDPGPIDGRLGPRTQQALRNYQRDYNLPITGRLNARTRQKLLGDERVSAPENRRETPPTMEA